MKKLLLGMTLSLAIYGTAISETPQNSLEHLDQKAPDTEAEAPPVGSNGLTSINQDKFAGRLYPMYRVPETTLPAGNYGGEGNLITYDPISDVVAWPYVARQTAPSRAYIGTHIDIMAAKLSDLKSGAEPSSYLWVDSTYRIVGTETGLTPPLHISQSLSVLNPTGNAMTPDELGFLLYTRGYAVDRSGIDPEIVFLGGLINIIDPSNGIKMDEVFGNQDYKQPAQNNTVPPRIFSVTTMDPYQGDYGNGWEAGAFMTGLLQEPNSNDTPGYYGAINFDFTVLGGESFIPSSWEIDEFRTDANYSTSHVYTDVSEGDGTPRVYWTGINALYSDDFDNRKLGVSFSEDGINFSSWAKLQPNDMNAYINQRPELQELDGYITNIASGYTAYTPYGFAALNDEEASFFVTMYLFKEGGTAADPVYYHLVQVTYNRMTELWSFEKVADISNANRLYLLHRNNLSEAARANLPAGAPAWFLDNRHPLGNNIQVAKSPDGELLLKYTKYTETVELSKPIEYFESDGGTGYLVDAPNNIMDSMNVDEVFLAIKSSPEGNWEEVQVTNDGDRLHPYTFIPKRFKDRFNIPFLNIEKINRWDYTTEETRIRMVDSLDEASYSIYQWGAWDAQVGYVEFIDKNVEEQAPAIDMQITDIYPNPVSSELTVAWSMSEARDCKVYLSNSAGVKVLDIFEGRTHSMSLKKGIDVSQLTQGAYFITLEANGQKVTKLVNIVR